MDIPDEQIDIVNERNQVITTTGKSVAHKDGLLHRIVIGELLNSTGEYCFVRQASDRQDPGQFVSPIGGHVGAGEPVDKALIRECEEEVGFTPQNFQFVGSTIYAREVISRQENHLFLVYQIMFDGAPVLNHESVEYRWFSVADIQRELKNNPKTFGAAWHHVFKNCFSTIYS
jgi:8-oxo-dGTP pyrophosphatase MutT (NUDIX family)